LRGLQDCKENLLLYIIYIESLRQLTISANNKAIDPSHERCRIAFQVIAKPTLQYIIAGEEYDGITYHVEVGMREIVAVGT
jgi:hypothetical protein